MWRWQYPARWESALAIVLCLWAFACEEGPPVVPDVGGSGGGAAAPEHDASACASLETGCPCEPGEEPVSCFLPPEQAGGGRLLCAGGTRVCRDGAWSACEGIATYTIAQPKSLGTPQACNVCDPNCIVQTTTPVTEDLVPGNHHEVVYDPSGPGLTLPVDVPDTSVPDTDGDGVPDVIDECVGPGHRAPCDGSTSVATEGFAFTLPAGQAAQDAYPPISLALSKVDYYVLIDTTGSMEEEIGRLAADLISGDFTDCNASQYPGILGAIRCKLPGTAFGVGMFREYPRYSTQGQQGVDDIPFHHLLDPTTDFGLAQNAVDALNTNAGGAANPASADLPESAGEALYALASGNGLGPWVPARGPCPNGGVGYACFRPDSIPIVLVLTDAPFKGGPSSVDVSAYRYGSWATTPSTYVPSSQLQLPPATTVDTLGRTVFEIPSNGYFELGNLTNRSVTVLGTTQTSSLTSNMSGCGANGRRAPYIRFTLDSSRTIRIDTNGSDFDTYVGLRRTSGTASTLACNDDRPNANALVDPENNRVFPLASYIRTTLSAGTYIISVDSTATGSRGAFQLRIWNEGAPGSLVTSASTPRSWASIVNALNAIGAKTIGIAVCNKATGDVKTQCPDTRYDLEVLGRATGSVNSATGDPFVYLANADGSGLSTTVVNATLELANQLRLDVALDCVDNPSTPIDECAAFAVRGIPRGGGCPATCTGGRVGDACMECAPGTQLDFDLHVQNVGVAPTDSIQVFEFDVRLLAGGVSELSRVPVRVVVPPVVEPTPNRGWFEMVYDSTDRCDVPNQRPDWSDLAFDVEVPEGTAIEFELRTAQTRAALATATPAVVRITSGSPAPSPLDVGAVLRDAGIPANQLHLAVRAVLETDGTTFDAPILRGFELTYHCFTFE